RRPPGDTYARTLVPSSQVVAPGRQARLVRIFLLRRAQSCWLRPVSRFRQTGHLHLALVLGVFCARVVFSSWPLIGPFFHRLNGCWVVWEICCESCLITRRSNGYSFKTNAGTICGDAAAAKVCRKGP